MDDSWHILRVKSGTEVKVAIGSGVPAYVPRRAEKRYIRRQRKTVWTTSVAFPGYVFLKVVCPDLLRMPPSADVFGFMRNGDRTPAILSERVFAALQALEMEMLQVAGDEPLRVGVLTIGDQVVVDNPRHALYGIVGLLRKFEGGHALLDVINSRADFSALIELEDLRAA